MRKLSDRTGWAKALAWASAVARVAAHPYGASLAGVALMLVAIATDLAARAGWVAFFVLCALHVRRERARISL